jgi:lantibiotic leader peptide-processing serine protease
MRLPVLLLLVAALLLSACADPPTGSQEATASLTSGAVMHQESPPLARTEEARTTGGHLVMLRAQRIPPRFERTVVEAGGEVERIFDAIGVAVVSGLGPEGAETLAADPSVAVVTPEMVGRLPRSLSAGSVRTVSSGAVAFTGKATHQPQDAFYFGMQWNLRAIHADRAWAAGRVGSPGVTVAILDTGIDWTHPDLLGRVDLARSVSFVPADDALVQELFPQAHPIADLSFHGTHVAATVSSNAQGFAGVTSLTTLIGVKVCDMHGDCPLGSVLAGILYAADAGADIINLSLGGYFQKGANPGLVSVFQRAMSYANREGAVVIAAAGNEGIDLDRSRQPGVGTFPSLFAFSCDSATVVCVSATGPRSFDELTGWDGVDTPAFYSNFGRSAIDVAAPGGSLAGFVWAACSRFSQDERFLGCGSEPSWIGLAGTSMASPHTAGVAALIVSEMGAQRPGLVRQRLHQSADDLAQPGTDPWFGKGRVNAARAVGLD